MNAVARTLSTADERREAVLEAGVRVFAERGVHGTPTLEVARAAGISQAYLFRLFPSKEDLAVAVVRRVNERIRIRFADAAAAAREAGEEPLHAMGMAYCELLEDRNLILVQLHAHAASASVPAVRDAMREGFADLVGLVCRESGASDDEVRGFFASGMLMNVVAALGADALDAPWARVLSKLEYPPEA